MNTLPSHRPVLASLFLLLAVVALLFVACSPSMREPAAPAARAGTLNLGLVPYASGFNSLVSLANAGDGRMFVVEQAGVIRIIDENGDVLPTPFLNISDRVDDGGDEEGLLGLTFHPDYSTNGYFYVNYTSSDNRTRISRFSVTGDPNIADPNSEEILLTVNQPFSNHNAGDIHFGPDGYLYIPLGDGGSGGDPQNNAQTFTNLLGMISRIDVDNGPGDPPECEGAGTGNYTIPAGNGHADGDGPNCDEIWAAGLRNPWRSSFDRETGDFWIADVGQGSREEIDLQPATSAGGENYGWACYEGNILYNDDRCTDGWTYTFPVFEYNHTGSRCAVVGGFVYRGSFFSPMYGRYFLTDYCSGEVWDLAPDGQGGWIETRHTNMQQFGFTTFGQDNEGELYLAKRSGEIYHLVETDFLTTTPTPGGPTFTPTSTSTATPTPITPTPTDTQTPTPTSTAGPSATPTATSTPPVATPPSGLPLPNYWPLIYRSEPPGEIQLELEVFGDGFDSPVSIASAGDDRLFVVEQAGVIRILDANGNTLPGPFLDITGRVDDSGNEEGLLGLAFHPDYANNGYFYINYTDLDNRTRISRFSVTADPNIADPNSEEILLTVDQPYTNHNAGDIQFGPDGYLYIPLGDGGTGGDPLNNAQTFTNLLGVLNRIDVDGEDGGPAECFGNGTGNYTIPPGNGYADGDGPNCDEIWAIGLRNPWRSSFDRETGDFWIADVGQNAVEEVNIQLSSSAGGENYGWACYEGSIIYNDDYCNDDLTYIFPVFEYTHGDGGHCAVVGGYVYRGSEYPNMIGRYLLTDHCSGIMWDLVPDGHGGWITNSHTNLQQFGYTAFGQDANGELYLALRSGTIYHVIETSGGNVTSGR